MMKSQLSSVGAMSRKERRKIAEFEEAPHRATEKAD